MRGRVVSFAGKPAGFSTSPSNLASGTLSDGLAMVAMHVA
jgi:hypothetical protein